MNTFVFSEVLSLFGEEGWGGGSEMSPNWTGIDQILDYSKGEGKVWEYEILTFLTSSPPSTMFKGHQEDRSNQLWLNC